MTSLRLHASCAAKARDAVLLLGPSGAGKSDLLLRLIDRGFVLVADDQVEIENGEASPTASLAGLVEARGLGLLRFPYVAPARLRLVINLRRGARLPEPARNAALDLPTVDIDPWPASAAYLVELALGSLTGGPVPMTAGALA